MSKASFQGKQGKKLSHVQSENATNDQPKRKAQVRMRNMQQSSRATLARKKAYDILQLAQKSNCYVDVAFDQVVLNAEMPTEEKAFARLLARGVISTQGVLDNLINCTLSSPHDIDVKVRCALRISAYELFFLAKSPHAAVDQGVELVKYAAPRASGVANFVLRRLTELVDSFPFSNPQTNFDAAAFEQGFPRWLAYQLKNNLGSRKARVFMAEANNPAPLYFMINPYKASVPKVLAALQEEGVFAHSVTLFDKRPFVQNAASSTFVLEQRAQAAHPLMLQLVEQGNLFISDLSAQSVASCALPEKPPKRFLEIGSGKGTKTLLLQSLAQHYYGHPLVLDAVEVDKTKASLQTKRAQTAGVPIARQYILDASDLSLLEPETYDAVLVDAPCTGVGTLRRHPDIRWRLKPHDSASLAQVGLAMLEQAANKVAPLGRLTYATCTCFKEENQAVVEAFLASETGKNFTLVSPDACSAQTSAYFETPLIPEGPDLHFAGVFARLA